MFRGITLIELLLVLALIALLAAVLFPVFQAARDSAWSERCLSDLRQLGMAFALYAQDNDEVLPLAGRWNERSLAGWVFADGEWNVSVERGSLYPYVGNARVYRCGSEQNLAYTVNNVLAGRSLATVLDVVLLVEESEAAFGGRGPNDGVFYNDHEVDLLTKRHRGGGHVLWLDGHLRWIDATRRFDTTLFGGN